MKLCSLMLAALLGFIQGNSLQVLKFKLKHAVAASRCHLLPVFRTTSHPLNAIFKDVKVTQCWSDTVYALACGMFHCHPEPFPHWRLAERNLSVSLSLVLMLYLNCHLSFFFHFISWSTNYRVFNMVGFFFFSFFFHSFTFTVSIIQVIFSCFNFYI